MTQPQRTIPPAAQLSLRLSLVACLDRTASAIYDRLCGTPPNLRPWHWQWAAVCYLYRDLRRSLGKVGGRVLDVGCGNKPYSAWFKGIDPASITGIDTVAGPGVDILIQEGQSWPFPDAAFEVVLCTQVLEHVADLGFTLREIERVLAPKGRLIVSVPFLYGEHGAPMDYRRFSRHGMNRLFADAYDIAEIRAEGGLGSTICILLLSWIQAVWDRRSPLRMLKIPLLPAWLLTTLLFNTLAMIGDFLDPTCTFYNNIILIASKKPHQGDKEQACPLD